MKRVVSLFLPNWSTDRLRRMTGAAPRADTPLVVIGRDGSRRIVTAADAAAAALGVRVGMPAAKAQALAAGLEIHEADPTGDAEALERLALWILRRVAPIVAADPPDGIVVDTTGADHLHGGEAAMLDGLVGRLAMSGVSARAAVADTWGAAYGLARFGTEVMTIIPTGHGPSVISGLPIEALRLPSGMPAALRVLGFDHIGDLIARPRAPLALRFGPELGRRLDQALGRAAEPIETIRTEELIETHRAFAEPISAAETIARYIGKLVDALCAELERKGQGARRLDLICQRVDSRAQAIRVSMAKPVRDTKRLSRLLRDKIETIDPGFGIEMLRLRATIAEPLEARQIATSLAEDSEPDISDLIDTLANRVGERAIYRSTPVPSDVPERSVGRVPPLAPDTGATWPEAWPRPARLMLTPEPVETIALLPDHPPVSFTWRGVRRRVRRADGPERVFGEWWKRDAELAAVRDYFRIEDEAGERYWLYRAGDGEDEATGSQRWFIHGVFG